jgi:hypothetical protein
VGEDGGLIAGHARVLAARQLGIAEVPVMVAAGWISLTGKKLTKAANATRDSLLIPSHTTNKGASAIFGINWSMTRLG